MNQNLNSDKIAEILQKTPTAEAFATYAACRERNVRDGVSRLPAVRAQMLREGFSPVPQDLLSMFRELERAGIGQLKGDQFKWNVSIKSIGSEPTAASAPQKVAPKSAPKSTKRLVIYLGQNREVDIEFTPNLSKEDVSFIADKLLQECKD